MNTEKEVLDILDEVLGLHGNGRTFTADTPLMGTIPELDSMAVVSILTALEEHFDFVVDDDEIDGDVFENVGSLVQFVHQKL